MLREKKILPTDDQLKWSAFDIAQREMQEANSREIMRRASERASKKIEEIFAETPNSK